MATAITVAQALAYENNPSTIPAGAVFDIVDAAANIETLSATDISNFASLLNVTSMTATDAPVTFTPGGAEQAALKSAGIHITAQINAQEVIQLDVQHNMSGSPVLVPPGEHIIVLDTAANLEALTPKQLSDLGTAVDRLNANGVNTGNPAFTQIAATDAPAVFSDNQVNALTNVGSAGVGAVIVAPPNDPSQNDGNTIITGRGTTFDIVWDSSVASAPDAFKTDVEQVFQFFADTYSSPVTLYYHVGYGEVNGNPMGADFLGRSQYFNFPQESYSSIVSQLEANATSPAQTDAYASLPASDPFAGQPGALFVPGAEARVLGFSDAPTTSESSPDGYIGFATDTETPWDYSANPNQTPVSGEEDFLASVEHELTEVLGRGSYIGDTPNPDFSVMDLFRFTSAGTYALTVHDDPAYFSIDGGTTNLGRWNDFTTGDTGDPGDWWSPNGSTVPPNSFNDYSDDGIINPFTANDATLMNVLGYNFTSAPVSPIPLPASDITLSAGQLLEYLTLDSIKPGSMNAPAGESYVVIDTAFALESITAAEITQAISIGVSEFIVDGQIAFLQTGINDPADDQVGALGATPFISVLTVAEALTDLANPPNIPPNQPIALIFVGDTAANIETLDTTTIAALGTTFGITQFDVTDLSGVGPLIVQNGDTYAVHGAVTADATINFAGAGGTLEFDDTPGMKGTIAGFMSGDRIVLSDITFDAHGSADLGGKNTLDITENGVTYALQFDPTQNFTGDFFHLFADPTAGTDITEDNQPCYCRGTLIRTPHGEKRVELLKIGDEVMTRSGAARPIKWIGRRSYAGRFIMGRKDILPVCIKAGALGDNAPRRDLWISPLHAMYFERRYFERRYFERRYFERRYFERGFSDRDTAACAADEFDGVLIEAKDLINGQSIVQVEHVDRLEYFHIELNSHDVIFAEGVPSETFIDDDSRSMFHNAGEFHALYPQPRPAPAQYCAPRLREGFEVAAVRRRIAKRAGHFSTDESCRDAPLRGYVDETGPRGIKGWAQNSEAPEVPICLDIYAGDRLLGQTLANLYCADLAAAGLGSGRHAFSFALPAGFTLGEATIEVRRSLDGARLADAPRASHQRSHLKTAV